MKLKVTNNKNLFLKSLIESDFLFLEQKARPQLKVLNSFSKINKNSGWTFIDPVETTKNLKQLIRTLRFLKNQDSNFLHCLVENKQYLDIIQTFLQSVSLATPVSVKDTLPTKNLSQNTLQVLILLNFSLNNKETFLKRLFDKNIFLINKINSKIEKNNWGTYKIYNDLTDVKKIIFLLVIISNILEKKIKI
jgi:hypothetical protein